MSISLMLQREECTRLHVLALVNGLRITSLSAFIMILFYEWVLTVNVQIVLGDVEMMMIKLAFGR